MQALFSADDFPVFSAMSSHCQVLPQEAFKRGDEVRRMSFGAGFLSQ